jgi:hypothetical protein
MTYLSEASAARRSASRRASDLVAHDLGELAVTVELAERDLTGVDLAVADDMPCSFEPLPRAGGVQLGLTPIVRMEASKSAGSRAWHARRLASALVSVRLARDRNACGRRLGPSWSRLARPKCRAFRCSVPITRMECRRAYERLKTGSPRAMPQFTGMPHFYASASWARRSSVSRRNRRTSIML